jgi:plastocyanin
MKISGSVLLLLVAVTGMIACAGLPTTSRTGGVHDVTITDDGVSPQDLIVQAGDEVRWINRRSVPVWVSFYEDSLDELSCSRGFRYFWGLEENAKIEPGQSVSLCFAHEDAISYRVQDEPTVIRGSTAGEGGSEIIPVAMHAAIIVEEVRRH